MSFQLADEPPLGTYTISVDSGKTYSTFSVEEYGMEAEIGRQPRRQREHSTYLTGPGESQPEETRSLSDPDTNPASECLP